MKIFKILFGYILVLSIIIGGWMLVVWAISSWSDYNDTKKIENCYSVVGSEISSNSKIETICGKLYPSAEE